MKLAIYYHRYLVSTGKPICVSNGRSEIHTNKIILEGISGQVIFNSTKGPGYHKAQARRHGTTTPLEIEILPDFEDDIQASPAQRTGIPIILTVDQKRAKAIKERGRYRNLHPEQLRYRKDMTE